MRAEDSTRSSSSHVGFSRLTFRSNHFRRQHPGDGCLDIHAGSAANVS
jgi:hypothetical protein